MKICLDVNVFIDYYNSSLPWQIDIKKIFEFSENNRIKLYVSSQSIQELKVRNDQAYKLSETIDVLPHYPVGSWDEQVGRWNHQSGTWDKAKENDIIQLKLKELAKSGNGIRDRGAFIDSLKSKINYFVTSDNQFVKKGPKERINSVFDTKVIRPTDLIKILISEN